MNLVEKKFFMLGPKFAYGLLSFTDERGGIYKAVILFLSAIAVYVFPNAGLQETALAAFSLIGLDTITGIIAVFIERKPRTSTAFARVIAKLFAYFSVCVVASVVERTILKNAGLSLQMAVLWLVIATEGISILENVERISGGRFTWLRTILGKVVEDDRNKGKENEDKS